MSQYPGVGMPPNTQGQQQQGQQGQQGFQPQPPAQNPYGIPQVPQQQNQQNYQPQSQQQPQQQGTVSGEEILDGANVPPELRGRKVKDVLKIYGVLADDFLTRSKQQNQQGQQQNQNQQQQRNGQPQQQQNQGNIQRPQQQQSQDDDGDFWQNPDARLRRIVGEVVNEAVQPFQQQNLRQGTRSALEQARQSIPDFNELEADIMETVRGSSPEALANPDYWQHAADLARGRRLRKQMGGGQHPQPQPQQQVSIGSMNQPSNIPQPMQPQQFGPNQNPQGIPQPQQPGQNFGQPRPQTGQFFTEAPTAPSPYQNTHAGALTPAEQQVAELAGITHQQYAAMRNAQTVGRR